MQSVTLNWILEQKKSVSGQTSEIQTVWGLLDSNAALLVS